MASGVSVIICCYNSGQRLPETIKHITAQRVSAPIQWEVIIVDNASTDNTKAVAVHEFEACDLLNVPYSIVEEPVPGLIYARKKGIEVAKFEYLIFCDDDNYLQENYIEVAYNIMSGDERIAVLGACGVFEPEQPAWPEVWSYKTSYVNGAQTWAKTDHWVYGAGAVFRKSLLRKLSKSGWETMTQGRTGTQLTSGEDVELCFIHYLMGYQITASDQLIFKHFVPISRQNKEYLIKLSYWLNYSSVLLSSYYAIFNTEDIKSMTDRWFLSAGKVLVRNAGSLLIRRIRLWKKLTIEQKITLYAQYGTFVSLLKNRKRVCSHNQHIKKLLADLKIENNSY